MERVTHLPLKSIAALVLGLMLVLTVASSAFAAQPTKDVGKFVDSVHQMIQRHWPHMDKVWPGSDYQQHALLLLYVDDDMQVKEAFALTTKEQKKLSPQEYQDVNVPLPGGYAETTYQGMKSLVMSIDDFSLNQPGEDVQTYRTATHELVHFYHQPAPSEQAEGSRAQAYPLDATPRLYRQMLYQNLIGAYDHIEQADVYLAKAKYWLDTWQKAYPEESEGIRGTDIMEGTAKYIENLGFFIGDQLDAHPFHQAAGEAIPRDELFPSADGESYELGYVAALLLDKTQPDWKKDFYTKGLSPVELLLSNRKPQEEKINQDIQQLVETEINEINEEAKPLMQDVLRARQDATIPWLKVDITNVASSYDAKGNYLVGSDDVITGFGSQYRADKGNISLRNQSVVMQFTDSGENYLLLPLTMAHEYKDGVLNIKTKDVIVENIQVKTVQENGNTYHIVQAENQ